MTSIEREVLRLIAKLALDAHNAVLPNERDARLMLHRALERMGAEDQGLVETTIETLRKRATADYTDRDPAKALELLNRAS